MAEPLRIRKSIQSLQEDYQSGRDRKPLEDLIRAWRYIQALPAEHPQSFFTLGGFHGEPFRGAGWGNSQYWGGYCNHGNVLFPTWHRVYLLKLEEALRSAPGCGDVTLPFWDETAPDSLAGGIPEILTQEKFHLDGEEIDNPLRSFTFTQGTSDFVSTDNYTYSKPKGYRTVRYPLSGLVGNDDDLKATNEHNAQFADAAINTALLNQNVVNWLTSVIVVNEPTSDGKSTTQKVIKTNVHEKYRRCLETPNYTAFSNTSSAEQWNFDHGLPFKTEDAERSIISLEDPHNDIHLAVGGFELPGQGDDSPINGANGDMGENNTAGLDPIFFFHHCFIDRVFWLWQQRHGATDALEILPEYPGTNTVDNQGPTPGMAPNTWLTLDTPLNPFRDSGDRPFTSRDCINIESQLGYTYGPGSLEEGPALAMAAAPGSPKGARTVRVHGVSRGAIRGSFLISLFATVDGVRHRLASKSFLSRWNVQGCANCQSHLDAKTTLHLGDFDREFLAGAKFDVEVQTRDGLIKAAPPSALPVIHQKRAIHFEVR